MIVHSSRGNPNGSDEVSMSTSHTIPRDQWRTYFDHVSRGLGGKRIEIEADSLDLGTQIVAEWMQLLGITYDSHNDLFDIALAGPSLDHLIRGPQQVLVQEGENGIESIAIEADNATHVLRLKNPLLLPAGESAHTGSAQR
jgi:hypothetical protein